MSKPLLALDTATEQCSVALSYQGTIYQRDECIPRQQAKQILSFVDEVMQKAGVSIADIAAIGFTHGPGSFTGLRVAASVVQGLAFADEIPVYGVSTLAIIAQRMYREFKTTRVLSILDARMKQFYWGEYRLNQQSLLMQGDDQLTDEAQIAWPAAGAWAGAGLLALTPNLNVAGEPVTIMPDISQSAYDIIPYLERAVREGLCQNAEALSLNYLRNEVVQKC